MDACGEIVALVLTGSYVDDGRVGVAIIDVVSDRIQSVTADAAYDTKPIYDAAETKGAEVLVPPSRKASASARGHRSKARDHTIKRVKDIGRRKWKKESGYHRQGRVENTFYRYKTVIDGRLRARVRRAQETEAVLACNALKKMRALGCPMREKVPR